MQMRPDLLITSSIFGSILVGILIFELYFHLSTGMAFASGLATTMTIAHLLKSGDGIICMNDVYGGKFCISALVQICIRKSD